jgi:hypothetical protein
MQAMTTQKTFKRRVRTRMAKTGESYTAARRQLLDKAEAEPAATPVMPETEPATEPDGEPGPAATMPTSPDAMLRATGRTYEAWFELLDAEGPVTEGHTAIARWLSDVHGVPDWWTQTVTVGYERARGLRATHETTSGFQVGANRTIGADAERVMAAFTEARERERWLPDAGMTPRPTTAANAARFDWPDPPSRVAVWVVPKGAGKATVSLVHEKLPDADAAGRLKAFWRERLGALKADLER